MASNKQIGIGMMIAAWIILLALLYVFFHSYLNKQQNPNQQVNSIAKNGINTIILKRNRNNHYVLTGKINGHKTTFLLDTGATNVTVPSSLAKKLDLKPTYSNIAQTANGLVKTYQTKIDTLTMGTITLHNVNASINAGSQGNAVLLGMSALKHLSFTQNGDELTIAQAQAR